MDDVGHQFFRRLFQESLTVINRFPLTRQPASMEHIVAVLEPTVAANHADNPFVEPVSGTTAGTRDDIAVGMNTSGMLLDRLSILAIKQWNLVHRANQSDKVHSVIEPQVAELIAALVQARPGHSSINNKMTTRQVAVATSNFPDAYYNLLTTNLLLWEAQEILYNHDIISLPCEELRAYIDFFSRGNIARNMYIQASDTHFWENVKKNTGA